MSIKKLIDENEKTFNGRVDIKYLFLPSKQPSDYIFVMFSGFNGSEKDGVLSKYQYIRHTEEIDCNKLFILDIYDGLPCYYLGKNKKTDYEESVVELIDYISQQINAKKENIITCGSSKGGTAALYLAMKYSYGHTVVGGMQTKVGDYIFSMEFTRNTILPLIVGDNTETDKDFLDDYYQAIFNNPKPNTEYNIHGGKGDIHYIKYVAPFLKRLDEKGITHNSEILDYSGHSDLKVHYPAFLVKNLKRIIGKLTDSTSEIEFINGRLIVDCEVPEKFKTDHSLSYAFYIYKDNEKEPIKKSKYTPDSSLSYTITDSGVYKARIFIKHANEKFSFNSDKIHIKGDK